MLNLVLTNMVNAAASRITKPHDGTPGRTSSDRPADARRLAEVTSAIAACRICRDHPSGTPLPHEPRPVLRVSPTATVCVVGQAPGTRVHASGVPFSDPSGDRLREWMGVDSTVFYDTGRIAIVPMGFCFPGQDERGADLPPRRECAPAWRAPLFAALPRMRLLLAVGSYAHAWHLGEMTGANLTETVANWREVMAATASPVVIPLPHPSWRNNAWLKRNPWFAAELLPVLRDAICREVAQ